LLGNFKPIGLIEFKEFPQYQAAKFKRESSG
jgi:hypothetical protein